MTSASHASLLPREGDDLTILLERGGVPVTHRARAGKVDTGTLLLPRTSASARWPITTQDRVTVMYQREGRLYLWPMRVEEVLPSSAYLVGQREPTEHERRAFVRARVQMGLGIAPLGGAMPIVRPTLVDLSAAGLSATVPDAWPIGEQVTVSLSDVADGQAVRARAEVIRCVPTAKGGHQIALNFYELASADEERLVQLVFRARETALSERLGRRR